MESSKSQNRVDQFSAKIDKIRNRCKTISVPPNCVLAPPRGCKIEKLKEE